MDMCQTVISQHFRRHHTCTVVNMYHKMLIMDKEVQICKILEVCYPCRLDNRQTSYRVSCQWDWVAPVHANQHYFKRKLTAAYVENQLVFTELGVELLSGN